MLSNKISALIARKEIRDAFDIELILKNSSDFNNLTLRPLKEIFENDENNLITSDQDDLAEPVEE